MAISITITIPGDAGDESTALGRVKRAIDWHFGDDPEHPDAPQNAAEYKQYLADFIVRQIREEVKRTERARQRAELAAISEIEVVAD